MLNIKVDSRKVKKGDTFIALRGISSDGHDYINKAIELGASKIIAEEGNYNVDTLIVNDTRTYLEEILYENYKNIIDEMNLIGVTGTNGKTTTCFLLSQAFNKLGIKAGYIGTIGFYMNEKVSDLPNTTPDILEMYEMIIKCHENGFKTVVMEVSSHGIANRRIEGLRFNQAVFTNLTEDHLDFHITMENYALEKQKLFKRIKENGYAVINSDDQYNDYFLLDNINTTYGFKNADLKINSFESAGFTKINYTYKEKEYIIETKLLGKFNVYNISAMILVLLNHGISMENIQNLTKILTPPPGRLDNILYKTNNIIIDYAHTPAAIENVIETVKEVALGDIYVVFGCTGDRDRMKRPIMTKIVTDNAKYAIITNDDPHTENTDQIVSDMLNGITNTNFEVELDRKKAIITGINKLKENDFLLILGKGHEEFMIIGHEKIPFNDMKIVKEYLK